MAKRFSRNPQISPKREHSGPPPTGWLIQCPPGLAAPMKRELTFSGVIERRQNLFINRQRNHDLLFLNRIKAPGGLARLRIAEMILDCPVFGRFKISQRQLGSMAEALHEAGPRRLVVSVTGRHFQRHDLMRFLEREMAAREYKFDSEIEDEVWMFCVDDSYYFGLPVKKARMAEGRENREAERAGSLPPPIAASLAFTLSPRSDDVALDPCCGSGTLLAEFHAYAPEAGLIGFDIDPGAIRIAQANLPAQAKLETRDARTSGLNPGQVTAVLANLPFGLQFGKREDNPQLYRGLINESLRLAHPTNFRALFFSSDTESLKKAASQIPNISFEEALRVKVRGELATAFLLKKR